MKYAKAHKRSWKRDLTSLKHLIPYFEGKSLDQISREDIEAYKRRRKADKTQHGNTPTGGTTNRELALLKTLYNRAIQAGRANKNPVAGRGVMFKEDNR